MDLFSLTATIVVVGGVIYGVIYVIQGFQASWASTKESLKTKGLNVSHNGIFVKTSKRFDHEEYMEATRRGLVKAAGASSFGNAENATTHDPIKMERVSSDSSSQEKKKKGIFRRK